MIFNVAVNANCVKIEIKPVAVPCLYMVPMSRRKPQQPQPPLPTVTLCPRNIMSL